MVCKNCNSEIKEVFRYCPFCGAENNDVYYQTNENEFINEEINKTKSYNDSVNGNPNLKDVNTDSNTEIISKDFSVNFSSEKDEKDNVDEEELMTYSKAIEIHNYRHFIFGFIMAIIMIIISIIFS